MISPEQFAKLDPKFVAMLENLKAVSIWLERHGYQPGGRYWEETRRAKKALESLITENRCAAGIYHMVMGGYDPHKRLLGDHSWERYQPSWLIDGDGI